MNDQPDIPTVMELFAASAARHPERPALEKANEVMTYGSLSQFAARIATAINRIDPATSYAAVNADRSLFSYAATLGILMAGKGYVPLNPKFPPARNEDMIHRSGVKLLLSEKNALQMMGKQPVILTPEQVTLDISPSGPSPVRPEDPAYLLFTSGTTGKPKGVPVNHRNLASYLHHMIKNYDFRPDDRFSQVFDMTFDLSVHDIFLSLASGACLVIPGEDGPLSFYHYIRKKKLTCWFSVPTAVRMMRRMRLLKEGNFPALRYSFFCGEPLGAREADEWGASACNSSLVNLYGPTEATIAISEYEWQENTGFRSSNGVVSIGRVFGSQRYRISMENNREDSGELWLSGSQVVEGYYHDEINTKKSFVRMDDGTNWYRTGDLVSRDEEGYLYFLGRTDQEVKVHGYRVNLLGVEEVLINASGSHAAVLHVREKGTDRLIAFVEAKNDLDEAEMIERCRLNLPWYMVPEKVIFVKNLPLNPNGKTDRNKLREMISDEQ